MKKRTPLPPVRSTQVFHHQPEPLEAVCDFCDDPEPIWSYPARIFPHVAVAPNGNRLVQHMTGPWRACEACSTLIEADDRDGLHRRQLENTGGVLVELQEHCPVPPDMLEDRRQRFADDLRRIFEEFTAHRTGPRVLTGRE